MANNNMPNLACRTRRWSGLSMGNGSGPGLGRGMDRDLGRVRAEIRAADRGRLAAGFRRRCDLPGRAGVQRRGAQGEVDGDVLVNCLSTRNGNPQNVHVIRGVGMGLDEKAVER